MNGEDGSAIPTSVLPDGVEDAILNRTQLVRAFGKSENAIDK
ncbi:MAG: hypothetical protein AAFY31_05555 [Pseudomonadota bacterium]